MSEQPRKKPKPQRPKWVTISLNILRALLVPVLCLIAVYVGLIIGYVYLGGEDTGDVLKIHTWKHLIDLIFSE